MHNAIASPPPPVNEPVLGYAPGSPERASLRAELARQRAETVEVLPVVDGRRVETGRTETMRPPHDLAHTLGTFHKARTEDVEAAIAGALRARHDWSRLDWTDRAAVFLKAADLLAGPFRDRMNAATMLGQSKNPYQAEIDAACEMVDFFRFNVHFYRQILEEQPASAPGVWNRTEVRPLEGFVFAVTPFNFTSIAANLPTAPALLGNAVLWKPAPTQTYSAQIIVELLEAAGMPPGVVQFLPGDGADVGDPVLASPHLAGLHFTGSTATFNHLWHTIGQNLGTYRAYPRIVGETGGKDFIVAHESADPDAVATAIVRGAFEYQGQKCSAASRVYVQEPLWPAVCDVAGGPAGGDHRRPGRGLLATSSTRSSTRRSFDKIAGYIDRAHGPPTASRWRTAGRIPRRPATSSTRPSSSPTTRRTRRWSRRSSGRSPRSTSPTARSTTCSRWSTRRARTP